MVNILTNYVSKYKILDIIEIGSRPVKLYDFINASCVLSYTFSTPSNHHQHIINCLIFLCSGLYQVITPDKLVMFCAPELQIIISGNHHHHLHIC